VSGREVLRSGSGQAVKYTQNFGPGRIISALHISTGNINALSPSLERVFGTS